MVGKLFPYIIRPIVSFSDETIICDGRYLIFVPLVKSLGLVFYDNVVLSLDSYISSPFYQIFRSSHPFQELSLKELNPKVKSLNIVSNAQVLFSQNNNISRATFSGILESTTVLLTLTTRANILTWLLRNMKRESKPFL